MNGKFHGSICPPKQYATYTKYYLCKITMEGELFLPMLPSISRQARISPKIKHSIVSIGALYDAGFTVTFRLKDVTVVYKKKYIYIILRGWRNYQTKLWNLPL